MGDALEERDDAAAPGGELDRKSFARFLPRGLLGGILMGRATDRFGIGRPVAVQPPDIPVMPGVTESFTSPPRWSISPVKPTPSMAVCFMWTV